MPCFTKVLKNRLPFRDNFTCYVELYLDENSTAHAHNVLVHVMSPYYMGFGSLFDVHDANVTHISNLPEPGMSISVNSFAYKCNHIHVMIFFYLVFSLLILHTSF